MSRKLLLFALLLGCCQVVTAQRLPLWELGGAIGAAQLPYYRGAAKSRDIILPLPLAAYRGKKYSVDKEGAHRWLFDSERFKLDLSLAGGLPVPKDGAVKVREGMPALDALLEMGPVLDINVWQNLRHSVSLHFPLRAAASVDWLDMVYRGVLFSPYLHYMVQGFGPNRWQLNLALGPQFATADYHAYYYSVAPGYETEVRPTYKAAAGYSGARVTFYANKRFGRLWLSVFARYDDLRGAAFRDSPLLERNSSLIGGMVVGWVFLESSRKVNIKHRDRY